MMDDHPPIVKMAEDVYEEMLRDADDGLWEGKIGEVVARRGNRNRHSEIMKILKECGAIEQLRRGAGPWASQYRVHEGVKIVKVKAPRAEGQSPAMLGQRLENIESSLAGIDVARALADLGAEIGVIKAQLREMKEGAA